LSHSTIPCLDFGFKSDIWICLEPWYSWSQKKINLTSKCKHLQLKDAGDLVKVP
jgi:hypothetical protein